MKRPRAAILPILLGLLACSPLACGETEPQDPGDTPPPPASTGASTGPGLGSDDTAGLPSSCSCLFEPGGQGECPCQACAADYALGDPIPPPPEAFTCRPDCIPAGEPRLWCFYDAEAADPGLGCCSGTCRPDGLCGEPGGSTDGPSTESGSSTDTGTSTAGTTAGTSSSTDTGTSSSTDTGTSSTG